MNGRRVTKGERERGQTLSCVVTTANEHRSVIEIRPEINVDQDWRQWPLLNNFSSAFCLDNVCELINLHFPRSLSLSLDSARCLLLGSLVFVQFHSDTQLRLCL